MGLIREFTGGNPEIEQAARSWWESEESNQGTDADDIRAMAGYLFPSGPPFGT
jgi:hypothetical protein